MAGGAGLASSVRLFSGHGGKDVVVAVGSHFTTLDPYDANDTLFRRRWRGHFIKGAVWHG